MTENYSSGNIKIREKLSMHKRHNFLFCKFSKFIISEGKISPLSNHKITKSEYKTSPLKTTKYQQKYSEKIPTYKSSLEHLYDLLTSTVQIADVSLYETVAP